MNFPVPRPRSDLPTVLMHWGLVLALMVSVSTGWRIASMTDSSPLLRWVDVLLLQGNVLRWHFVSAAVLTTLVIAYIAFLVKLGLGGRLTFRIAALKSPDRATRWASINKLVYWISFALLLGAAFTGVMMYFFPPSHWSASTSCCPGVSWFTWACMCWLRWSWAVCASCSRS